MRCFSCLRYVLVGFVLVAAATPIALALCWEIVPGAGASGTQSGRECIGGCNLYIDCPDGGDVCKATLRGAQSCTTTLGLRRCVEFVGGTMMAGSDCCTGGTPRGSRGWVMRPVATASGSCFLGIDIGFFGPKGYPGDRP